MKHYFLLPILLILCRCSKFTDDTHLVCSSNCTTLAGRFITSDNVGLQGVKITLKFKKSSGSLGGGSTRLILETETDKNGYFHEEFFILDDELGSEAPGFFHVEYDDTNLDVEQYILSDNQVGNSTQPLGLTVSSLENRNVVIGNTYYLPKKTTITVNLNNFSPQQESDYFEVITLYPFGSDIGYNNFLNSKYATGTSGIGTFQANGSNTQLHPFVAENETNIIRIARRKNGVNSFEDIPIFVPKNNSIVLSYTY